MTVTYLSHVVNIIPWCWIGNRLLNWIIKEPFTKWDEIQNWAYFLSRGKLRLCSANLRAGYFSSLACDWLSIVWVYSEQETENRLWSLEDIPVDLELISSCIICCSSSGHASSSANDPTSGSSRWHASPSRHHRTTGQPQCTERPAQHHETAQQDGRHGEVFGYHRGQAADQTPHWGCYAVYADGPASQTRAAGRQGKANQAAIR